MLKPKQGTTKGDRESPSNSGPKMLLKRHFDKARSLKPRNIGKMGKKKKYAQ